MVAAPQGGVGRAWVLAARPRTLPAAFVPVLLGTTAAWAEGAVLWAGAGWCLAFALVIQIGANFANDADDFASGADTAARLGPTRAVAAGLISYRAMRTASYITLGLAFIIGLSLIYYGGWGLLAVGVFCVLGAIAYTGGPFPLGYRGWGDVMVMVYFGFVAVGGTFYVQTGHLGGLAVPMAVLAGALATNLLVINNHRDAETDTAAGKRTLAVRFGRRFTLWEYRGLHALAVLMIVIMAWQLGSPWPLVGALPLPLAARLMQRLVTTNDRTGFSKLLAGTAAHLLLTGLLTATGIWLAVVFS